METGTASISIIIPFYNTEKELLERCIDSVLQQTNEHYECIIVDDGSREEYKAFLPEFESKDSRIRVIQQENKGLGSARNFGVRNSKGEYVFFLDSDDYISSYVLETALEVALATNADMVIGGLQHIKADEKPNFQGEVKRTIIIESPEEKKKYIHHISDIRQTEYQLEEGNAGPSACSRLVRRETIKSVPFTENKYWDEDDIWNIKFAYYCNRIVIADILWYAYVINPQSMVRGYAGDRTKEFQFVAKAEYDLVKLLWPDCMQAAYFHIWNGLLQYCRTDTFQPANPNPKHKRYNHFKNAIAFREFYESIRNIDFDHENRFIKKTAEMIIRKLLLLSYKRPAYIALYFTNKKIVF